MNYLKKHKCGSKERYPNGACRPCALKKQRVRNRAARTEEHIEKEKRDIKNNELKEIASKGDNPHYESLTACKRCGDFTRYICNGGCSACN
ncbi:hypothetical protein [Thalassotalea sp. ND16A]|uniref:hypothetical protein n=1 Tax=Thalassotalea sp. ND16A TaxID=1535422 RepID=UPI00051A33CA|nr:hypothetical protein [Thalassotalea sp. ND16A]KGJ99889.1 hypothetical protein ND16A_3677 [Thalassotalea sp. ND16A]